MRVRIHHRVRIFLHRQISVFWVPGRSHRTAKAARLKLPNLWRTMDITSAAEKALVERKNGRERAAPPPELSFVRAVARCVRRREARCATELHNDLPFRIRTDPDDLTAPAVVRAIGAREALLIRFCRVFLRARGNARAYECIALLVIPPVCPVRTGGRAGASSTQRRGEVACIRERGRTVDTRGRREEESA